MPMPSARKIATISARPGGQREAERGAEKRRRARRRQQGRESAGGDVAERPALGRRAAPAARQRHLEHVPEIGRRTASATRRGKSGTAGPGIARPSRPRRPAALSADDRRAPAPGTTTTMPAAVPRKPRRTRREARPARSAPSSFSDSTGSTQGMRLRMSPPSSARPASPRVSRDRPRRRAGDGMTVASSARPIDQRHGRAPATRRSTPLAAVDRHAQYRLARCVARRDRGRAEERIARGPSMNASGAASGVSLAIVRSSTGWCRANHRAGERKPAAAAVARHCA